MPQRAQRRRVPVDVLQFLGNRLVTDADTPGAATKVARDVLYGRRPDLGDLDLSCENTDLPLPYLDLVCELLEEAVAPDAGLAFGGPLSGGVDPVEAPSAGLLSLLQGQGWPFTDRSLVYEPDLAGARVVRDVGVVAKATPDGAGGWFVRRLRQTTGTALELAAAPQYVNAAAYALLAGSRYAFALPFDLAHEETRSYFAQFDIARADVMRALRRSAGPSDEAIAAEELGISDAQRQLVVTADPAAQDDIWNTAPLGALGGTARVDNFLARARLDYRELTELLALAWVNPGNAMFVKHLDTGSDLSAKRIQQLTDARLDRIHRFLRLLRAPACTGWTPPLLDRAIRADALGGVPWTTTLLVAVAALHRLAARLGLPLPEVVDLFAPLDEARYAEVFRNTANGPVLEAFEPANVLANEQAELTTPGSGAPLSAHEAYLATCLGATTADTALLVADLPAPAIVSNVGLHAVYAGTLLARALGLTTTEYLIMKDLIGSDPLTAPAAALDFVELFDAARAGTGIRPADLRYLLRHVADDLAARDLPDETLTAVLTGLQAGYQSGYAATRPAVDPAAPPEENLPGMRALLATVPGMTEADLAGFASIMDGGWTDAVTTPAQFVDAKLAALVDTTPITAAIVANPTEAQQTTLLLAITTALSSYAYTRTKRELAVAAVADSLRVLGGRRSDSAGRRGADPAAARGAHRRRAGGPGERAARAAGGHPGRVRRAVPGTAPAARAEPACRAPDGARRGPRLAADERRVARLAGPGPGALPDRPAAGPVGRLDPVGRRGRAGPHLPAGGEPAGRGPRRGRCTGCSTWSWRPAPPPRRSTPVWRSSAAGTPQC